MATATTMSGLQFDTLPYEEGRRWELLEGELIQVSSPTPRHQAIVFNILIALREYLASGKGVSFADVEFALSDLLRLRPDVCVLLKEKAAQLNPDRIPVPGAADMAIEVISSIERAVETTTRSGRTFAMAQSKPGRYFPDPEPSRFITCQAAQFSIRRGVLSAAFSLASISP